eukprot:m.145716 g.145716  ORF g.145716 m.145716 type:complete len:184 (-) comp16219_c0_seq12:1172-1723(-)
MADEHEKIESHAEARGEPTNLQCQPYTEEVIAQADMLLGLSSTSTTNTNVQSRPQRSMLGMGVESIAAVDEAPLQLESAQIGRSVTQLTQELADEGLNTTPSTHHSSRSAVEPRAAEMADVKFNLGYGLQLSSRTVSPERQRRLNQSQAATVELVRGIQLKQPPQPLDPQIQPDGKRPHTQFS